ncbi:MULTISPECIES: CcmD family protein [unclassified Ekhidna]|jgi:membrane protein DedA with SNARE-associated domain|uniref:CcmD family protein n=1 Tax=unclassified Ekhidna TaxID=2632188 RepID=UPI0032DF1756
MLKYIFGILMLIGTQFAHAQVEMADDFRGEGKIYVVIAIILVILAGFFFLLFKLDKRSKRLEREIEEK